MSDGHNVFGSEKQKPPRAPWRSRADALTPAELHSN